MSTAKGSISLSTLAIMGKVYQSKKKEWIFLPLKTSSGIGTGLGLFIIKRILKEMNGYIIETGDKGVNFECAKRSL